MGIVVIEAEQRQHCRADIGVIRPDAVINTDIAHAWADHAKPGSSDFWLYIPMVPGETRLFRDTRRITVSRTREQEVVGIGEHS